MDYTIYFGGCQLQNMGNAFIDIGAKYFYKKYNCLYFSEWSQYYFGQYSQNYYDLFLDMEPKCIFFSGMVTCPQFLIDQKRMLDIAKDKNIPIILNGVGGEMYTEFEVQEFRKIVKNYPNMFGFISRDDESYEAYKDLFPMAFKGIDCAFFMPRLKQFSFLAKLPKIYVVINDDNGFNDADKFDSLITEFNDDKKIYSMHCITQVSDCDKTRKDTIMGEFADEYITLYARSKVTFSTRIHASIATLAFGGKTIFLYNTPRIRVLKKVSSMNFYDEFVSVDPVFLKELRNEHEYNFKNIMKEII